MTADALAEWQRVAPRLAERGILAEVDRATLAAYCQSWGRWLEAERLISAEGAFYTVTTKAGEEIIRKHPAVLVADQEQKHLRAFAGLFGLTPADRPRVPSKPPLRLRAKRVYPRR